MPSPLEFMLYHANAVLKLKASTQTTLDCRASSKKGTEPTHLIDWHSFLKRKTPFRLLAFHYLVNSSLQVYFKDIPFPSPKSSWCYESKPSISQEPNDKKRKQSARFSRALQPPLHHLQVHYIQKIFLKSTSTCWLFSWDASCSPDAFVILTNPLCFALFLFHSFCTGLFVDVQEQSPLSFVDYWNPFIKRLDLKQQAGL